MNMEIDNEHYTRATQWLARLHAHGQPDWNDPEFSIWLQQSEDHRLAFAEASGYWFAAEELPLELDDDLAELQRPVARRWRPIPVWTGFAIVLVVASWFFVPLADSLLQQMRHDFYVPDGQVQAYTLADGSVITLGGETSIDIEFSATERRAILHAGEAFFDVATDPNRPFSVLFPSGDVVVLGTHFGLAVTPDQALVGVVQGRVDAGQGSSGQRRILGANELVVISESGLTVDPRRPADVFSWTEGQLVFKQQTLSGILTRMDPYVDGRIVLLGEPKVNRRFSLVVSLGNPSQALGTLAEQAGLKKMTLAGTTVLY